MKKWLLLLALSCTLSATELPVAEKVKPIFHPHIYVKWLGKMPIGFAAGLYKDVPKNNWRKFVNSFVNGCIPSKESIIQPYVKEQFEKIYSYTLPNGYHIASVSVTDKKLAQFTAQISVAIAMIMLKVLQGKEFVHASSKYILKEVKKKIVSFTYKKIVATADYIAQKHGYIRCNLYPEVVMQDPTLNYSVKTTWHIIAKLAIGSILDEIISI